MPLRNWAVPGSTASATTGIFLLLLLVFVLYSVAMSWAGYEHGRRDAEGAASRTIAALQADFALSMQRSLEAANRRVLEAARKTNDLATALSAEQSSNAKKAREMRERSQHVNREYRIALDDPVRPVPAAVFTVGWLRAYNTALGASPLPEPFASAAAVIPPDDAAGFDSLESGLTPQDILAHASDYGAWCLDNAAQVNRLLDAQELQR